jgi:acetyl esterase
VIGPLSRSAVRGAARLLARRPIEIDGQRLHPEAQALLRVSKLLGLERRPSDTARERTQIERDARLARGARFPVGSVDELRVPGAAGELDARLYAPAGRDAGVPLLVYFHGGGYVVGSLDTHDQVCRYLCSELRWRVLAPAYRLAPEHPFPAAIDDALAVFLHAAAHAGELGAASGRVSVGGDSAGGGLAASVALLARDRGGPAPERQLLIYPWCDLSARRRSYDLFGEGFFLTEEQLARWSDAYCGAGDRRDLRVSPLLADDLAGLPPAHLLIAGFDPLRDEGLEYAERLRAAGNTVTVTLAADLIHAFVNASGVSERFEEALGEFAGAVNAL